MTVYVITKGCYSDYGICAVTLDKEVAERLRVLHTDRWDDAMIEEYDTDAYDKHLKIGLPWEVSFNEDGSIRWSERKSVDYYKLGCVEKHYRDVIDGYVHKLSVTVLAETKEAAIKIAAEKRAEYLATKMGI